MSCCGRKNSKFYDRPNLGQNCCGYQSVNSCCSNNHSNNGCCDSTNSNTSSSNTCRNYMTTAKSTNNCCGSNSYNNCCGSNSYNNCCGSNSYNNSCYNNVGYDGLSCPFHNNNDCECENSLRDALCTLTNQRVIIHIDGCKMCVVIVSVGDCFVKAINPCTQKIVYFNINRIDNVEDVLPRCY
ncbi:MAG: hypothetical protein J6F30_15040 [Cellulosilyticum sp.]|nr:hypothetical protein [Cellulosilyticum sp.]